VSVFFHEWQHLAGERLRIARACRRRYEQAIRGLIEAAHKTGDVSEALDLASASPRACRSQRSAGLVPAVERKSTNGGRRGLRTVTVGLLTRHATADGKVLAHGPVIARPRNCGSA